MSDNKLPQVDFNMSSSMDEYIEGYIFEDKEVVLKKIKEIVQYTLKQAEEKMKEVQEYGTIDDTPILSLKDEIIKKLGL